ncbi:Multifunctional enzyme HIS4 [Komagataella phaffii GS115]|uniref:Histidine biosynthesis trifunctional protein n=1 Tax=Komagataella phaffii (strain GS115 / ATCC 20864) TaxID=644223 RepID=C4QXL7_KOMPG|nr:Multifunctional enzyme HIS4 [Komagataella phaffii GS115]AOA65562.1 GQ68_02040T0 [Komagataella phaffii GS115]CAY67990.1 Multifunctional enzyme HIS4 [Komagataella phaffii GS115]
MTFPLLPAYASVAEFDNSLSLVGKAVFPYAADQLHNLIKFTQSTELQVNVQVESSVTEDQFEELIDNLLKLYNNGINEVILDLDLAERVVQRIPGARVIYRTLVDKVASLPANASIAVPFSSPLGDLKSFTNGGSRTVYAFSETAKLVDVTSTVASGIIPIIDARQLTTEYELSEDVKKFPVSEILLASLTTDRPDGLFTTLVADSSNYSLGLVYSSKKSIPEAIRTQTGVYQSRRHGLWYKGATSGATQKLLGIELDCDGDCLKFVVEQTGVGFCHLERTSCFGQSKGLRAMEATLWDRKSNAPEGSYTKRLFDDEVLLNAKIREEADELAEAKSKEDIAWECADLFYFALVRCAKYGVTLDEVERNLDMKSLKVTRRKGDAKPGYTKEQPKEESKPKEVPSEGRIELCKIDVSKASSQEIEDALRRPIQKTEQIMELVKPIVDNVRQNGDKALLELTAKFDGVALKTPVLEAPFPEELMQLPDNVKRAIDLSIDNVRKFHEAQLTETLQVETCPGVVCSRFARPIEKVGLYIPGGTAILPSTSLMLGVPAKVAGRKEIVFASPPKKDGTLTPEVIYVAHKVGAKCIVLAGGAQAVAAMAYGTETVPKCDKIFGPGNQFVTAAKMMVQNDTSALCSIDMPAGPSEVLVIADKYADPDFVASDLLSQAEHGIDSQVILLAVDMTDKELARIEDAVHNQAVQLPRVEIVRKCIAHSTTLSVATYEQALEMSNQYAPEHLILQIENASSYVDQVQHAGSVFVGAYSPESCGDYSSGTNHTLPTYGYARQYSGVNTATFQKFITSQDVTPEGLKHIGQAVMDLAAVEGLDAHRNAVKVRMEKLGLI